MGLQSCVEFFVTVVCKFVVDYGKMFLTNKNEIKRNLLSHRPDYLSKISNSQKMDKSLGKHKVKSLLVIMGLKFM